MKKAWRLGLFLGVLLLCEISFAGNLTGKSVPGITIRQWITKNPPDIKNLAGRVYVFEFWATWCSPCVKNIPHLNKLNNKYKDRGLELVALSQDKSVAKLSRFVRDKGINYHVALDNGTVDKFDVMGYPTVFVANHQGKIVWQGYPWDAGFEQAIAKAIAKSPSPLLAGIDLGIFKKFGTALDGGKDFARAYRKVESYAHNKNQPKRSAKAKRILKTIDQRLRQKINQAQRLQAGEPDRAYSIYADIVARYDGIEITKPARVALLELETASKPGKTTLVAKRVSDSL